MKKYFARLTSMERRFVVGVLVVSFVVLNAMFVWPRFADWAKVRARLNKARSDTKRFEQAIAEEPRYKKLVRAMESEGSTVPLEDQSIDFVRTIQSQAAQSGVTILNMSARPASGTNQFFLEKAENMTLQSNDEQLVDFLYRLGSGNSLIRVRTLTIQPDPPRQSLRTTVELIASYQKKPAVRSAAPTAVTAADPPRRSEPAAGKPATTTDK